MIKVGQGKLPDTKFHTADMTAFKLSEKFDVILCIFDSVNHLLTFDQWEALFDRAKEHLSAGGVFIVDMNTIAKTVVLQA